MINKYQIFLLSFCILITQLLFAQNKETIKQANDKFISGNFDEALESYIQLLQSDINNTLYNYRTAVCYLNTNNDKSRAIPYLELIIKNNKDIIGDAYYLLGRSYHFANRFDDAIKLYSQFKQIAKGSYYNLHEVDRNIQYCYNAKELLKFPLNVTFENLGKNINSVYPDYFPFISKNEGYLIYNSRRDHNQIGADGKYYSDVYLSNVKDGVWQKSNTLNNSVNTINGDEEVVGISPDGNQIIFNFDNSKSSGDLFISAKSENNLGTPTRLSDNINSKDFEIAAALSTDDNAIYFASNRSGGYGGMDIYVCHRLPNGEWGPAQNLGPVINTKEDEDFPSLSLNGKILLFSSKGHTTMGGYDIFKSVWNDSLSAWGPAKNFGYPVNTSDDDMNLCLSEDGRHGYISSYRNGGMGDLDIYRVTFNDLEPRYTILKGHFLSTEESNRVLNAGITITDKSTNEVFGSYLPNPNSMNYVIILPPGKYELMAESDGFESFIKEINILDKVSYQAEIAEDIKLKPKK